MLPPNFVSLIITFIVFWSWWTLDGVVSDPQTHLVRPGCTPSELPHSTNFSGMEDSLNATFRDIREQIITQNKYFATAQEGRGESPAISTLFQCRNYLSVHDCVACFDVAAIEIRHCPAAALGGGRVFYDGCFLRYETSAFFDQTTSSFNTASCGGNQTKGEASTFTSAVRQQLMNLQMTIPKISGSFAAMKTQVPNNGPTIYAFAQCIETVTESGCFNCLNAASSNMPTCLPNSDGRAFADGCFMRYSTTSFFPDNQTIGITPLKKQGSSNKGAIIGGVVAGSVILALIVLAFFLWAKPPKNPKRVPGGGDTTGASKLKGPVNYSYKDLKLSTKNFNADNKLGQGGFGTVYKGTLKNGKVVAVKKLTLRHSNKVEDEFESEVKLISNVHHRNLVRLLGYCSKDNTRILVYEYMKNTSLDKFLFGEMKGFLGWKQRYDIILGTARGLAYLHEEFHICIIHRDIKSNNILLDDDFQPKIADFGLAKLLSEDKSHLSTKFAGTLGYTAPEYALNGQLSEKADVYSYGVVILEIISGRKSEELNMNGEAEGEFLLQKVMKFMHLELVDNTLDPIDYAVEEVKKIIEIGLLCTQASPTIRPTTSEVVVLLQNKGLFENMRPTMPFLVETN
ncbi:cysteine-rich receptor-like protein kinase 3 isoform X2 [Prosopis cineraria]|uniref:cysteine-rich receptor-like protein kinase 3 isoform X2 n=1 Tax=Prosopis cineraria TaxID=364024 RepID=UPI002410172D|nr:cysteine-rich receptor-like protein kinase 3 isoform X2 [Prosopis cineraria]